MLLGKDKLNSIEVLIYKGLINPCISHGKFVSVINELREYYKTKKEVNIETYVEYII